MRIHIPQGSAILALLLLLAPSTAKVAAAQSYPPPPPPPPGAYDDQPPSDDQGGYYSDNYQDQGAYEQEAYPTYDNQGPLDVSLFYRELAPDGRWIERGRYGWVWEPMRVPIGWRPYLQGRWVRTDYGWTWISDEPWGWATYHYGRWLLDPEFGWVWVPGTEWGPAWVAFQEGDGYIGWAPLPPSVGFRVGIGIQIGGLSLSAAIDPLSFCFVPERSFLDERIETAVLPPARNVTLVRTTRNVTNIRTVNDRVVNEGIPVQRIEQATGQRVRRMQLNESRTPARGRVPQVQGDQVTIFRPAVKLAPPQQNVTPPVVLERRQQQRQAVQPQPGQPPNQPRQLPSPHLMPPQPAPSQADLERKHQAEQQQLQDRHEAEQRRLQQLEQRDDADRQAQGKAQEHAAQHQAEQKALQEQHQREQQLLEARHQRERQAAQARPQKKDQQDQKDQKNQPKKDKEREKKPEPPPPAR